MNPRGVQLPLASEREHTRWQALRFAVKAWVFRARRAWENRRCPRLPRFRPAAPAGKILCELRTPLFSSELAAEFALQAGKVQNLRAAAAALDGIVVPAGEVFSFWKHVPRPTRARGFVDGRELREGCVIPSIGGGLCQLSNALYAAALDAGCGIVERHAHSRTLPGSMAEAGRDATVFWNYVDLRFRPRTDLQITVELTRRELVVRFRESENGGRSSGDARAFWVEPRQTETRHDLNDRRQIEGAVESCETCGVTSCFRHLERGELAERGRTAFVVDAWWPEFDRYLRENRSADDWLFTPLDSTRFRLGPYRWSRAGFAKIVQAPLAVIARSIGSRRLAAQGAERQRALLRFDEMLARRFAARLPFDATHVVVAQNLLPFLWRSGALGGRTFDVLMTRLPLAELEAVLDRAHAAHPQSRTLADFRADPALLADEAAALAETRRWITPHGVIARLAGGRALKLDWVVSKNGGRSSCDAVTSGSGGPVANACPRKLGRRGSSALQENGDASRGRRVVFPATTLGRKGAYELREVARELDLAIALGGRVIESADFWDGVNAVPADGDWLADAACVVLPAWVEHQPRRLLEAVAAGVPVIASEACGLGGLAGVVTVPTGDAGALRMAIERVEGCSMKLIREAPAAG